MSTSRYSNYRRAQHRQHHALQVSRPKDQIIPTSADGLFTIDRSGDVQNLTYGRLDTYKVPKYRSAGYGRLIGLDRRHRITSVSESSRLIDNEALDHGSRTNAWSSFEQHDELNLRPLIPPEESDTDNFRQQKDYVRFRGGRARNGKDEDEEGLTTSRPSDDVDSDSNYSAEHAQQPRQSKYNQDLGQENAFDLFKNHPDNEKNVQLTQLVRKEPQNLKAWLDLIEHQDRYYRLSMGNGRSLISAHEGMVSDMKLSLCKDAIGKVHHKADREKLVLLMMKEGSKVWDTSMQIKEWKAALNGTQSLDLWYEFLNFQQTQALSFTYDGCFDTYLQVFRYALMTDGVDHDMNCSYIFLRLTKFMLEAGYSERAISLWQAVLEYNTEPPSAGTDDILAFESFWDSESARTGETGAKGWHSTKQEEVLPRIDLPLRRLSRDTLFADWGAAEAHRSIVDMMPARTLDDTVEDDPFRIIIFSDVKDFLFVVKTKRGKEALSQAFLNFCDLPPTSAIPIDCHKWWADPFLCTFAPECSIGIVSDTTSLYAPQDSPLWQWTVLNAQNETLSQFASTVLTQLIHWQNGDDELAEYAIALHLQRNAKSARKMAKDVLRRRPSSLPLYNAYALVEQRLGNSRAADQVWMTALSMAGSVGSVARHKILGLWHSWIWELMVQQRQQYAVELLTRVLPMENNTAELFESALTNAPISPQQYLRLDMYLSNHISQAAMQDNEAVIQLTGLYAIFRYLSKDMNFSEVMAIYNHSITLLSSGQNSHLTERIHQDRARFIHFHTTSSRSDYRPLEIVRLLGESLRAFPQNSVFSGLHEKFLRKAGIVDKLRMLEKDDRYSESSITSQLQHLSAELSRPSYSGTTSHSVRRIFQKITAIDSPARSCANVWKVWINWELGQELNGPDTAAHSAKKVYLSSLSACPWHKDLILLGFTNHQLSAALGNQHLGQIYRSITDRGLRLRHDLSDIIDSP